MKRLVFIFTAIFSLNCFASTAVLQQEINAIACSPHRADWNENCFGAGALLLTKDGKVLLGQEKRFLGLDTFWDLFGGLIDPGETARVGAAREIKEETAGIYDLDLSNDMPICTKGGALFVKAVPYKKPTAIAGAAAKIIRNAPRRFLRRTATHIEKIKWGWVMLDDLISLIEGKKQSICIDTNKGTESLKKSNIRGFIQRKLENLTPQLKEINKEISIK